MLNELVNGYYLTDLKQYLRIMDELNNVVMSSKRRRTLEDSKEILEIILDMYEIDWR